MSEFSWKEWPITSGTWCVRAWDAPNAQIGDLVTVSKRSGETSEVVLGERLHKDGLAAIFAVQRQVKDENEREIKVYDAGVYENENGIYVVKPNQAQTRLYAKRLVETPDRLNVKGERVPFDFEYDKGAIFDLKPEDRMDVERAKALAVQYGHCIACGRKLKAAKSVEDGIGPVCIKKFRQGVMS